MSNRPARERVFDAFESLLRKKALSKITVEEIIKLANVSKPTFYRHFHDKYDLACKYHTYLYRSIDAAYEENRNYREKHLAGCQLIRDYKDVYASLFENPFSQNSFYEFFVDNTISTLEKHINKSTYTDEMKLELYRCLHGNVYVAWQIIIGNIDLDFDKSMEYLLEIMPDFIKPILQI